MSPIRQYRRRLGAAPGVPQGTQVGTPGLAITTQPASSAQNNVSLAGGGLPVLQLRDSLGNNIAQAGVAISIVPSPIISMAISGGTTDANGQATWSQVTFLGAIGSYRLVFSASGFGPVTSNAISLTAGPPSPAKFTATVPATGRVGVTTTITVQARDVSGNACTAATNTVVVNINGANVGSGTVTNNGNGTFSATYIPANAGTDSIGITADGTTITGSPFSSVVSSAAPAARILAYVTSLPNQATKRCIVGEMTETTLGGDFTKIDQLTTSTGKTVGLIGLALTYNTGETTTVAQGIWSTRKAIITGLALPRNPATGGLYTDTSVAAVHATITAGTTANVNFFGAGGQLSVIATRIQGLRTSIPGVAMLFRMFHEVNGNWFWWSGGLAGNSAADIKTLYQLTHDYLVNTAGLGDTLIFDYNTYAAINSNEATYYPGSAYVDVTSFDYYGDTPATSALGTYNRLVAIGKPIHWAEFGPHNATGPIAPNSFDETVVLNTVKNTFPKVFAVSCWNNWWAWVTQNNFATLMNDPIIATARDVQAPTR